MLRVHHDPFAKSVLIALLHFVLLFLSLSHWLHSVNTSQKKSRDAIVEHAPRDSVHGHHKREKIEKID